MNELYECSLFNNMEIEEINCFIEYSKSKVNSYTKGQLIFNVGDTPTKLYIVLEGEIAICKDTISGKRTIITNCQTPGEMFGEVFIFLCDTNYINYSVALRNSKVLEIPKSAFYKSGEINSKTYSNLLINMISIMSSKAYYLNQKLQLMSGTSLRQRISRALLDKCNENMWTNLNMSREAMADFLGTTRPSLSRELAKMHEEGLIHIKGRNVRISNILKLQEYT